MSLTSQVKNWYIKTIPGMNSKVEDLDLKTKWVELAQNCRFEEEPGSLDKRGPLYYLNTDSLGANPTVGLYRYYTSGGVATWIGINGTTAYSINDSGTKTTIRTSLTDGKRTSFATYKDLLIVSNGYDDMWVWDGDTTNNVTWELGACKAVLGAAGGDLDASAEYYYSITFDDDAVVSGAFSNTVTTDGTNKTIELSNIPLGPVGTTNRKIYRTEGDGSALKLVATLADNSTTTYSDTVADGSLTTALAAVTDDMPKGYILLTHRERLFISGDPNEPNRIYYSNVLLPHYIQQTSNTDYMDISPDDGDEISGLAIQLARMVCIKKNSIRKIFITSAVSGADPETWYADDPVAWIGSPAPWSIIQTPKGIVFLGWDHWYIFDGATAQPIFDEFDTGDILAAKYGDTVAYFHNENFYAAYTDNAIGGVYHNRLMVYNLKREALSIDVWTGPSITGPNCFGARSGDDEVGDLFFGDSAAGYILKEEDSDSSHTLRTKTECNGGTSSDTFVGGTENEPYIQIGSTVAALKIPDDIIIFWDNDSTTPGSGWTEITGNEGKLIKISTTAGTSSSGTSHLHLLTGSISWTGENHDSGDTDTPQGMRAHTHSVSANSIAATPYPRNILYRMFKKNSTTTEYEFPLGAIVMWGEATPPTGYQLLTDIGYYVIQGTSNLGVANSSEHSHTFAIPTSTAGGATFNIDAYNDGSGGIVQTGHAHTITGALSTEVQDTWEEDYVAMPFIKKVGEADTWDGTSKYCYCLFAEATAASQGWTEDTTYNTRFLKIGSSLATGDQANISHNHTAGTFTTSSPDFSYRQGGYHSQAGDDDPRHTHEVVLSSGSSNLGSPPSITFRLMKKELGKMKDYNDAIGTTYTSGIWTSPASQPKAETLLQGYWNESLSGSDTLEVFTRSGSSQAAVEDATAIGLVTNATNLFTQAGHGLVDTDRVVIDGTVIPTGLVNTRMYYVVNVAGADFQVSLTSGGSAVTFSDDGTAVTFKKWDGGMSNPNGTDMSSSAADWVQYCFVMTATDTTSSNPKIYFADGYVFKYDYHAGVTEAETSVNFRYGIGFRNFKEPSLDKVYKKIISVHEGTKGSFVVDWETENSTGSFTIPLDTYPAYWDSFFQDDAMGKMIDFTISKNDLNEFRISELKGLFSPYQVIL